MRSLHQTVLFIAWRNVRFELRRLHQQLERVAGSFSNMDAEVHRHRAEFEVVNACLAFTRGTSYDFVRSSSHSDQIRLELAARCSERMLTLDRKHYVRVAFGPDVAEQIKSWALKRGKTKGLYCKT